MKYAEYIDIPNWEQHQKDLIDFYYNGGHYEPRMWWWCHFADEVKQHLPNFVKDLESMGLQLNQLIYFTTPPKDINDTNVENDTAIFIHQDSKDEERYINRETQFNPTFAINIPLENCKGSKTFFYDYVDPTDAGEIFYPWHGCGGIRHDAVKEVFSFELNKPAALRINVPHGVFNPNAGDRTVATMRFHNSIDYLLKD